MITEEQSLAENKNLENKFSWKRVLVTTLVVMAILLFILGSYFFVTSRTFKIVYANVTRDAHEHFMDCYDMPFKMQVEKVFFDHKDIVERLKLAGAKSVEVVENKCYNPDRTLFFIKGDILITYPNREKRKAIENIIGDNFFGIPYRGLEVK